MIDRKFQLLATAALAIAAAPAMAADSATDAAAFGARQYIRQASLSPDGTKIALVTAQKGRGEELAVVDMIAGGDPREITRASGSPEHLSRCNWSDDRRIVCSLRISVQSDVGRLGVSRMISLNADGSDVKLLSAGTSTRAVGYMQNGGEIIDWQPLGKVDGTALMTRSFVPEAIQGSRLGARRTGYGVERVDTVSGKRSVVGSPRPDAVDYITDGYGAIRVMGLQSDDASGYAGSTIRYLYKPKAGGEWHALSTVTINPTGTSQGFDPYAVDHDRDVAIGFDQVDGRKVLMEVALDGSGARKVLLARPDFDVDGMIRIGVDRRVVGASFATEQRRAEFFDADLRALSASLSKALPGRPSVSFVDASDDESKLLLVVGRDSDPGHYYLYDKKTRKLEEVLPVRPELEGRTLATVKPITYPAADGMMIPGYLTLPVGGSGRDLPAIVMPHGGPGSRDELEFDWLAQFFAARGFAVLQPNFRGSTGYGDSWFQKNGFQSWRTAVGDVDDAGRWLVKQGIAAPGKLAIVGWSYGGYAALQSGVLAPDLFKAIVAIAPVTDLDVLREEAHNYSNFSLVDRFVGRGAHIQEGSPARHAREIKAPVLMFHGDEDTNVGIGESRLMANRLREAGKKVELVEFHGLDHQLEDGDVRAQMLAKTDTFLRGALGM